MKPRTFRAWSEAERMSILVTSPSPRPVVLLVIAVAVVALIAMVAFGGPY